MNDKEYAKQKARVQKYIDKWFKAMGLGWFHIDFIWSRDRREENPDTAAYVTTSWEYRKSTITFYLPNISDNDEDYLEGIVVHEFVHILVAPMMRVDKSEDLALQHEYATECVARAMRWVREAGEQSRKK